MNQELYNEMASQIMTTVINACIIAFVIVVCFIIIKSFLNSLLKPSKKSKKKNAVPFIDCIKFLYNKTTKQHNRVGYPKRYTTSNSAEAIKQSEDVFSGRLGEGLSEMELYRVNDTGRRGISIRNIYVPKSSGEITEVDLVYVTTKGIFVIESKNYSGWIFGDEHSQMWTACYPNNQRYKFYNPIKQNNMHVKWMAKYLNMHIPMYSITVFSDECELKKVEIEHAYNFVIKRNELFECVCSIWDHMEPCMTDEQVTMVANLLKGLTNVDFDIKEKHINSIQNK